MKIVCKQTPPDKVSAIDFYSEFNISEKAICIYGLGGLENINNTMFINVEKVIKELEKGFIPKDLKFINNENSVSDLNTFMNLLSDIQNADGCYTHETVVNVLTIASGHEWSCIAISEKGRFDTAFVFYDTTVLTWSYKLEQKIKAAFFDMYDEFKILKSCNEPCDIVHVYNCNTIESQKTELLNYIRYKIKGVRDQDIDFLFFNGYVQTPCYKKC